MNVTERRIERHETAIKEAQRFIDKARLAIADLRKGDCLNGTPATGAARRASMDLTRSLAVLRRNPWEKSA